MNFQSNLILLETIQDTIDISKSITEYGILVVIAAIFLVIVFCIFRRMINSYSSTVDGIIPKLEETTKAINDLKLSFNEVMSAHNAHSNQSLRSLERESKEIHESLSQEHKNIMEIESALNALQNNYNTLLQIMIKNSMGGRISPDTFLIPYDTTVNKKDLTDREKTNGDGEN